MRYLLICLLLSLTVGCKLFDVKPEDQGNTFAVASSKTILVVQKQAARLYDQNIISTEAYGELLISFGKLIDLVEQIESAGDVLGGAVNAVACVKIYVSEKETQACSFADVTKILSNIESNLKRI